MATRKKKSDVIEVNQPSNGWPKIQQGTHLIVRTFEDGRTELQWDDEQLLKEVQEAIASVETTQGETNGKTKKTRKSK